jgi:hypothetical protein
MPEGCGRDMHPMSDGPGHIKFCDPTVEYKNGQRLTLSLAWQKSSQKALRRKGSRQKLLQTSLRDSLE